MGKKIEAPKIGKVLYVWNCIDCITRVKVIAIGKECGYNIFVTRDEKSELNTHFVSEYQSYCYNNITEAKKDLVPKKGYKWFVSDYDEYDRPCEWVIDEKE